MTRAKLDEATAARVMKEYALPAVGGAGVVVRQLRWKLGSGDWWARMDDGWYWLGPAPHNKKWLKSSLGPQS